jgi:hypothetical protein
MVKVWKEIARQGAHVYIGEDGKPRTLDATPELVKYWFDQGKLMRSAGLSIPIPLEHDSDARPMTAAERAANRLKNNAGFVDDFDFRKVKDKDKDGKEIEVDAVFGLHDILDPTIAKKLPAIRWVSPWFSSFVDGAGKQWNGVISHSALTTRPRITSQLPFPDLSAAMSLAASPSKLDPAKYAGKGFALSRAGLLKGGKPAYPMAFSLAYGVKLAAGDFPKQKDEPPEKKKSRDRDDEDEPPPHKEGEDLTGEGVVEEVESLVDQDGDISVWAVICDLLECEGYDCGADSVTPENGPEIVYQALMSKRKGGGHDMANDIPQPPANPPGAPAKPDIAAPPLFMSLLDANLSLEDIAKIADAGQRGVAMSLYQQRQKVAALEKNAIEGARLARKARLEAVKMKLPKDVQDQLQKMADGAKFALGDDGAVKDEFTDMLNVLEKSLKIDVPALLADPRAAFAVVPHPEEMTGGMSEERRQAIVNDASRASGRDEPYKAKAS